MYRKTKNLKYSVFVLLQYRHIVYYYIDILENIIIVCLLEVMATF